jgi:hypothetical protein
MHPLRLPSLRLGNSDEIRTFSTVLDLLTSIDERLPFVGPDFLIPDELDADGVSELLERLSVNSAIALLIRNLQRSSGSGKEILAMLAERTKDEKYVSRVSPHLALLFLRRTARSAGQAENEAAMNILSCLLTPEQVLSMAPETAAEILEIARRPRFRRLLERFCAMFSDGLMDRSIHMRHWGPYHSPYHDLPWAEQDVGGSVLESVAKCGDEETRQKVYRFALNFWFRPGRLRLLGSIIRYAREIDGGSLLIAFAQRDSRNVFRDTVKRPGKISLAGLIPRSAFRRLPIETIRDIAWFAEQIGDSESVARLSELHGTVIDGGQFAILFPEPIAVE